MYIVETIFIHIYLEIWRGKSFCCARRVLCPFLTAHISHTKKHKHFLWSEHKCPSWISTFTHTHLHRTRERGKKSRSATAVCILLFMCRKRRLNLSIGHSMQSFGREKRRWKLKRTERKKKLHERNENSEATGEWKRVHTKHQQTAARTRSETPNERTNERTKPHDEWNIHSQQFETCEMECCCERCVLCYMRCGMVWVFTYRHHTNIFLNLALVFLSSCPLFGYNFVLFASLPSCLLHVLLLPRFFLFFVFASLASFMQD